MNNCINSKWDQLPSDIVLEILRKCEKIHACLSINKNWLKMTQHLLYREVQLKIKQDDPLFHTLTHSSSHLYPPGQFIFRIHIVSIDMTDLQPFISLITQSPHVQEILFLNPLMDSQWKYFELGIIRSNPTWTHLTKIFYPFRFDPISYQSYLNCASLLKNSLRHLTISTRRIHDLQAFFRTITHLTLNSVINSMIEFDQLVSCFPNLTEAGIDFHPLPSSTLDVIVPNTQQQQQHIKRLNILYAISASDQDLRYLQSRFSSLDFLQLEFHKLPQAMINNEGIIQSFFRHLSQHIPIYKVSFITQGGNLNHPILVLKAYFAGLLSSNATHALDIIYNKDTHHYQLPQIVLSKPTQFNQQQQQQGMIALEINSRGNFDYHVAGQMTQHILTDQSISFYFHTLRYHFNQGKKDDSFQLIHILPRLRLFSNLKTLVFIGANIMPISVMMQQRTTPATHILFQNCQFALLESFNAFINHFNQPITVELNQCEFYRHRIDTNEVRIYARRTAFVHLSLDLAYLVGSPEATGFYLKIQQERGTRCYFLDVENQDPKDYLNFSGQIDQVMYDRHLHLCESDALFIHIQVLSLEKLTVCWNRYRTVYDFSI
ncbi:hypothetical protein BD770DRAFT_463811 [Pilaira anomala]|nr:hypothetical protein BD770DRAFT_463811 [Pilaira anomala]